MRVLLYEHFCSGGLAGRPLDAGLLTEGAAMLRALAEDFQTAGQAVSVLIDERIPWRPAGMVVPVAASSHEEAREAFDRALAGSDAALVIAPETGDLLAVAIERIERAGVDNLGTPSGTVGRVSDKHALGRRLAANGIRTPSGHLDLATAADMLARYGELVIKPNRGAGCTDTYLCRSATDVASLPPRTDWLVQPRLRGLAASAAFIVPRGGPPIPLRAGIQRVEPVPGPRSNGGRLEYSGGQLPLEAALEQRAIGLGLDAIRHLPGLHGFVGIDLILGATPEQDAVIELNPRPTVAYVGLRRLARFLIPDLMLDKPTQVAWHAGSVRYRSDGRLEARHH